MRSTRVPRKLRAICYKLIVVEEAFRFCFELTRNCVRVEFKGATWPRYGATLTTRAVSTRVPRKLRATCYKLIVAEEAFSFCFELTRTHVRVEFKGATWPGYEATLPTRAVHAEVVYGKHVYTAVAVLVKRPTGHALLKRRVPRNTHHWYLVGHRENTCKRRTVQHVYNAVAVPAKRPTGQASLEGAPLGILTPRNTHDRAGSRSTCAGQRVPGQRVPAHPVPPRWRWHPGPPAPSGDVDDGCRRRR
jgi:hypothetical protein